MREFDFQWKTLESSYTTYTPNRVVELLKFTKLPQRFFKGLECMDAGCGNGRYTYALQELGGRVASFDISGEAIAKCRQVNPDAYTQDLLTLKPNPTHDFVLCWGVLHHLPTPHIGFKKVSSQVKRGGTLHIMVYHRDTQEQYEKGRKLWPALNPEERRKYCELMVRMHGGNVHGWWDAFNPEYNWSYTPDEVKKWFKDEGFKKVKLTQKYNINMRGVKR